MKNKETYQVRCALCGIYMGISLEQIEVLCESCEDRQDEVIGWTEDEDPVINR